VRHHLRDSETTDTIGTCQTCTRHACVASHPVARFAHPIEPDPKGCGRLICTLQGGHRTGCVYVLVAALRIPHFWRSIFPTCI